MVAYLLSEAKIQKNENFNLFLYFIKGVTKSELYNGKQRHMWLRHNTTNKHNGVNGFWNFLKAIRTVGKKKKKKEEAKPLTKGLSKK